MHTTYIEGEISTRCLNTSVRKVAVLFYLSIFCVFTIFFAKLVFLRRFLVDFCLLKFSCLFTSTWFQQSVYFNNNSVQPFCLLLQQTFSGLSALTRFSCFVYINMQQQDFNCLFTSTRFQLFVYYFSNVYLLRNCISLNSRQSFRDLECFAFVKCFCYWITVECWIFWIRSVFGLNFGHGLIFILNSGNVYANFRSPIIKLYLLLDARAEKL